MSNYIKIDSKDNVIITLADYPKESLIHSEDSVIELLSDIAMGHKVATKDIQAGEMIIKYGEIIGIASESILKGAHVHVHNVKTHLSDIDSYNYNPSFNKLNNKLKERKINVYARENGEIAIRNELWIVPTVGCVNATAQQIKKMFLKSVDELSIDGVHVFTHNYGCSQMGEDHLNTRLTLQDIVKHPNAGGVLVLGLGCENNQVGVFEETLGNYNKDRVQFLISQEVDNELESGVRILESLYHKMKDDVRIERSIGDLKIGLECGGSDGLSGITANPLLGEFSDYLITHKGTSVLTEVPEMFGAEHILMKRCQDQSVFNKTVKLINDFKNYYKNHNQVIYDNPSPGNKNGGITTLEEKSLGCIQKAGRSPIMDVLDYGELLKVKGVNLISAPGNDLVATTALGISGCHIVIFTTGRGTPFGGFVPTVKVSTNSELALKKPHWIDFDAGQLTSNRTMESLLEDFIEYICDVCSGKLVNNEINDFREIAIFKSGVTL